MDASHQAIQIRQLIVIIEIIVRCMRCTIIIIIQWTCIVGYAIRSTNMFIVIGLPYYPSYYERTAPYGCPNHNKDAVSHAIVTSYYIIG